MKQKFKRYLVIFPLVFTLLLSCVPLLGAHAADYSEYFLSPEDLPQFFDNYDKDSLCDILDDFEEQNNGYLFSNGKSSDSFDYYFYCVYWEHDSYSSYLNGNTVSLRVDFVFFNPDQITPLFEDDNCISYQISDRDILSFATNSTSSIFNTTYSFKSDSSHHNIYLIYNKLIGQYYLSRVYSESYDPKAIAYHYIYCQETNIPDFPITEGISHGSNGSLNVDVRFNPTLSGNVDRKIKADLSNSDLHSWNYDESTVSEDINLYIQNNSKSGVQVMMCIVQPGYRPSLYDRNLYQNTNAFGCDFSGSGMVYLWMSDEWNYFYDSSTEHAVMGGVNVVRTHSKTNWHYVAPGNYSHRFSWRQIDLKFNQSYDVLVYAVKNDYGVASRQFQLSSQNGFIDLSTAQLVYSSNFTCKTPYTFDPTSNAYGNMPSSSYLDYYEAAWSSDAYIDSSTGETIVGKKTSDDYRSVRNDYLGFSDGPYSGSLGFDSTNFSSGSGFTSLGYSISGFLSFFNRVFSFLPGDFISLIGLSITSLVVVSIFKGVFHG